MMRKCFFYRYYLYASTPSFLLTSLFNVLEDKMGIKSWFFSYTHISVICQVITKTCQERSMYSLNEHVLNIHSHLY